MAHLSDAVVREVRLFAFFLAKGTLGGRVLEGVDYLDLMGSEPSAIEQAMAIFANVLEVDERGEVVNASVAERRAAEYLRSYCDPAYEVVPELEDWEVELH